MADRRLRDLERVFLSTGSPDDELAFRRLQARSGGPEVPCAKLRVAKLRGAWPPKLRGPSAKRLTALLRDAGCRGELARVAKQVVQPGAWETPVSAPALAHPNVERAAENHAWQRGQAQEVVQALADRRARLAPGHLVRLFQLLLPLAGWREDAVVQFRFGAIAEILERTRRKLDLERVAEAFAQAGLDDALVGQLSLFPGGPTLALRRIPLGVYYARRPELVTETLSQGIRKATRSWRPSLEEGLKEIFAGGFPAGLPTVVLDALVTCALGKAKQLAAIAKGALEAESPDRLVEAIERVSEGRRGALRKRAEAWCAELISDR